MYQVERLNGSVALRTGAIRSLLLIVLLGTPAFAGDPILEYYRYDYPAGFERRELRQDRPCGATAPTTIAGSPCEPLKPWVKAVYAPFYGAGLGVRWTLFYGVYAPITTFFRSLWYGIPAGREDATLARGTE